MVGKIIYFKEVEGHWVIGNHGSLGGRSRRNYHPESNADMMLGKILEQLYSKQKRISFHLPNLANERNWYKVADLGEKCKFFKGFTTLSLPMA